jgi:putative addiction module component (TIGR02574 family)
MEKPGLTARLSVMLFRLERSMTVKYLGLGSSVDSRQAIEDAGRKDFLEVRDRICPITTRSCQPEGLGEYNKPMRIEPAELLKDALALPVELRAALVDSLLESLDSDADEVAGDSNAQEAWRDEIHRRLHQIDTGAVRMIPWDDARRILHSRMQR